MMKNFFLTWRVLKEIYIERERRGRTDTREQRVEIVKKNGGKVKY